MKVTNYVGLVHMINGGTQPKYVNLILNTNDREKVKYKWDEYLGCYLIEDKNKADDDYDFYLRDCLLDSQNFERCIEIVEEEPKLPSKIEKRDDSDVLEPYYHTDDIVERINGIIAYLKKGDE